MDSNAILVVAPSTTTNYWTHTSISKVKTQYQKSFMAVNFHGCAMGMNSLINIFCARITISTNISTNIKATEMRGPSLESWSFAGAFVFASKFCLCL